MAYPSIALNNYRSNLPYGRKEYSRLIAAAVVNKQFRKKLLENPALALASGYGGEDFHLGGEERARVTAIRAASLPEFARQLLQIADAKPAVRRSPALIKEEIEVDC